MFTYDVLLEKIAAYQSDQTDERIKQHLANEIVEDNEGLCIHKAKKFVDSGVEWDDLLNQARFGVYRAIEKFDLNSGNTFSTYACFWIRKYLLLLVDNNRLIYLPESAQRVAKSAQRLIDEGITEIEIIAETIGKSSNYVQDCVEMSLDVKQMPLMDNGVEMDFEAPVGAELEDSPIHAALATLHPILADICIKRNCGWKFSEIAEFFQCSVNYIRQLYQQTLEKLKRLLAPEPTNHQEFTPEQSNAEIPTHRVDRMPIFYAVSRACDRVKFLVTQFADAQESHVISEEGTSELHCPVEESSGQLPIPSCPVIAQPLSQIGPLFSALVKPFSKAIGHVYRRMGRVRGPTFTPITRKLLRKVSKISSLVSFPRPRSTSDRPNQGHRINENKHKQQQPPDHRRGDQSI